MWGGGVPGGVVVGVRGVAAATGEGLQGLLLGGHGSAEVYFVFALLLGYEISNHQMS